MKHKTTLGPHPINARLIIADDHELARSGMRTMLEGEQGIDLVGEATNGVEALTLCRSLLPDLALLDVRMPEMDGILATRAITKACPNTRVLIVTTHENPTYLFAALNAGAVGYLLKDVTRPELLSTIRRVLRGQSILSGDMAARMLQRLADQKVYQTEPPEPLTRRECEVLMLIVEGQTNREIASNLSISIGTVKIHVEHIIAKLGVTDRTQAAVRAVEYGLLHSLPEK